MQVNELKLKHFRNYDQETFIFDRNGMLQHNYINFNTKEKRLIKK